MGELRKSSSRPSSGRVIAVISPMGGDGRTTLCTNVSMALARLGKETTAVDPLEVMRRAWDDLRSLGDVILIDTPPGCSGGLEMTTAADEVIVVVMPWWHTARAAERLIEPVRSQHAKHDVRLVINHWRPVERGRYDLNAGEILEILRLGLLGIVPEDDYVAAPGHRGELAVLNPGSPAGQEYWNIARRLLGEKVPFMS